MGNSSSRTTSGGHDTETFFYEQTAFRKTPKRYKKSPDELPDELKFAHLNPKIAAILANKEKEKTDNLDFDDGLGNKSLLPEINRTVSLLRTRLDSLLSTEEDQQRQQFHDCKTASPGLLVYLAKYLYLFEGLHVVLPRSLEFNFTSSFKELIGAVYVVPREWQIASNKEQYLAKTLNSEMTSHKAEETARPETVMSTSHSIDDGDPKELGIDGRPLPRSKVKVTMSRTNTLGEINESGENSKKDISPRSVSRQTDTGDGSRILLYKKDMNSETPKPKGRLEKYKSLSQMDMINGSDAYTKGLESRKAVRRHGALNATGEGADNNSKWLNSGAKDAGYWAVINFQLSNTIYEEMGWIVHPSAKNDPERESTLEWATQKLQLSIKMKKIQEQERCEDGLDKTPVFRYYGDSRKEMLDKYKNTNRAGSAGSSRSNPVYKGEKPKIPDLELPENKEKRPLLLTTSDGATTVFYPSGRLAIIMVRLNPRKDEDVPEKMKTPAFYTLVYDNTPERKLIAAFTPSGRSCIYHSNGKVKLLTDKNGGTLSTEEGAIHKRWEWPTQHRLPVSVSFQITNNINFRCLNLTNMQLLFTCERESCKLNVGALPGCDEPAREELGHLISGLPLSSQAAKDFSRPFKPKSHTGRPKKLLKGKRSKAELEKLINFPEATENDEDADKDLFKIQRKIKNVVEDWMDHYRMAVGISSPYLNAIRDYKPIKRVRDVKSAKPGGGVVIIPRESTAIPRAKVFVRARSAYVEREDLSSSETSSVVGGTSAEPVRHMRSQVKFEDTVHSWGDNDTQSVSRTTTFAGSSLPGSAGSRSSRSRSAPQGHIMVTHSYGGHTEQALNPSVGLCPIALRLSVLGHQRVVCRCSRHKIPNISDVEFDEFIQHQAPQKQLIVIAIKSSLAPAATPAEHMLEQTHDERNRNRTKPCMQSRNDPYRLFWYDVISASDFSDHAQPLLIRRHNVVPGMFLVYESGNLVFCDHIFNGYGNARRDFQKQLAMSRKAAIMGQALPKDFKFSPLKGRAGMRSGWGGEIGGVYSAGKGHPSRGSLTSVSSGDSKDVPVDHTISGVGCSMNQTTKKTNSAAAVSFNVTDSATSVSVLKTSSYNIRPLSQPNFDSKEPRFNKLTRPKSQTVDIRISLPEIESSA